MNILKMENITMQFGGVVAVDNLSLEYNDPQFLEGRQPNRNFIIHKAYIVFRKLVVDINIILRILKDCICRF